MTDKNEDLIRAEQISNAVELTLARLRILIAGLQSIVMKADSNVRNDVFVSVAFASDIHEFLGAQWLEANSATPGESRLLLRQLVEAVTPDGEGRLTNDSTDAIDRAASGDPTVH